MTRTTYRGYGLEVYPDRTVVVRYGNVHCIRATQGEATAFIDGREQMLDDITRMHGPAAQKAGINLPEQAPRE